MKYRTVGNMYLRRIARGTFTPNPDTLRFIAAELYARRAEDGEAPFVCERCHRPNWDVDGACDPTRRQMLCPKCGQKRSTERA